jgi:hypothetical protein
MRILKISIPVFVMFLLILPASAEKSSNKIMSTVKEGKYNEKDPITASKLMYLPIPSTKEDYAILQSEGKRTSIVLGRFKTGEKEIQLVADENGDGKIDTLVTYYPDTRKTVRNPQPSTVYSSEQFRKMKTDIINGVRMDLSPNPEGAAFIKKIIEGKSNIVKKVKFKNGYKVFIDDPDDMKTHRAMFYFGNNKKAGGGGDLAFEVRFHNVGSGMLSPIVNFSVYTRDSLDPVVIETVDDLVAYTAKNFGE